MIPTPHEELPSGWLRRFGFRLLLLYLSLLALPGLLGLTPGFGWLAQVYYKLWQAVVPWVGREILRLDTPVVFRPSGSGDTLFQWVLAWCTLGLALLGAAVWAGFDRARKQDARVHEGVRVLVRYTLGAAILGYGVAKVLHLQMPFPSGDRLLQTYGDSSPMGLVWTFMGFSPVYSLFAGMSEVVGGVLLFFRRTTLAGALILVAVMVNVVMMNFCFDVPVKLYSTQLLLSAVFLTLPAWPRLAAVLFSNRALPPAPAWRLPPGRGLMRAALVVKVLLVGWILYSRSVPQWQMAREREASAAQVELAGLYEVRGFNRDGVEQPLLVTDARQWRHVSVNPFNVMIVRRMDRSPVYFRLTHPAGEPGVVELTSTQAKEAKPQKFTYTWPDADTLVLDGTLDGAAVSVRLRRLNERDFLLVKRGFHWVNEYPFNR
jgi:hypothetical protein